MKKKNVVMATCLAGTLLAGSLTYASPSESYILFLPKSDVIQYDLDEEHISEEYSSDDYTIMLYKAGEIVSLKIDTDQRFYIEDALENTVYSSYESAEDGNVNFLMPEEDILLAVKNENGEVIDVSEIETEAPANEEAEQPVVADSTEGTSLSTPIDIGNATAGSIKVCTLGNIKCEAVMTDGESVSVTADGLETDKNIDIIVVQPLEGGLETPEYSLYKDGSLVEDTSNIIINVGGSSKDYKVDLKNGWNMADNSWTLVIKEKGYQGDIAVAANEAEEASEAQDNISFGAGALVDAFAMETEPAAEEVNDAAPVAETEIETETEAEAQEQILLGADALSSILGQESSTTEAAVAETEDISTDESEEVVSLESEVAETEAVIETEAETLPSITDILESQNSSEPADEEAMEENLADENNETVAVEESTSVYDEVETEAFEIVEQPDAETLEEINTEVSEEADTEIQDVIETEISSSVSETETEKTEETEAVTEVQTEPETTVYSGNIDPDIPSNYVPVPERENMYMILDENGKVENYKIRVHNGSGWEWEDVLPGVVDVPGEQDVFMVMKSNGSIGYFKYSRNADNTYQFVEVDENGNVL